MKRIHVGHWLIMIAAVLALVLAPRAAQAQSRAPMQLWDGTLQVLDCDESVFMFSTPQGTVQFKATRLTAYFAGSDRVDQLCGLTPYLGTRARVWWASVDGTRVAGRIQVLVFPAQAVVAAASASGDHDDPVVSSDDDGDQGGGDSGGGDSGGGDSGGGDSGGGDSGGGDSDDGGMWPGHGHGDDHHDHGGPPGQTGDKPGNGGDGNGAPGQSNK